MAKMDDALTATVEAGVLPFAVAMAGNAAGITYSRAAGQGAGGWEAGEDTAFRTFSMTKDIGSFAAMILKIRGTQ